MNKLTIKIFFWLGLVWVIGVLAMETFSASPFNDAWIVHAIPTVPGIILVIIAGIGYFSSKIIKKEV